MTKEEQLNLVFKKILKGYTTHETYMADCETEEGYIPEDCIDKIVKDLLLEVKIRTNLRG